MKRKVIDTIFLIIFVILLVIIIFKKKENDQANELTFIDKCAFEQVNDDWIYYFCTSYLKDANNEFTILNQYDFGGYDILKKDLSDEYAIPTKDGNKGEIINYMNVNTHGLLYGKKTREDTNKINDYFNSNDFNPETLKEDLMKLDLKYIDVDIIVKLYEKSLDAPQKEFGKYKGLPMTNTIDKELLNGTIRLGYIICYGNIEVIKIDFINDNGEFLSDLVANNLASQEQIDDYNEIVKIEDEIIKTQELEVDSTYEGKTFSFSTLKSMLKELE